MQRNSIMAQAIAMHTMISETGINPMTIYCQITGAPIGSLSIDEWNLVWSTFPSTMPVDSIVDELYSRTIASMRPSPAWNYMTESTLNRLRIADPTRVCAYLLGRFFRPRDRAYSDLRLSFEDRIAKGQSLIIGYARLTANPASREVMREFAQILLMLDSHFDLSIMDSVPNFPKSPGEIDPNKIESYIPTLRTFYDLLLAKKLKLEKAAKLESSWLAAGGNRMANNASRAAFNEIKPVSEATKKRTAKEEAETLLVNSIRVLMDGALGSTPTSPGGSGLPKPKPQAPGAFKLKIGVKS